MKITETIFYKFLYLFIIPLLITIGLKYNEPVIVIIIFLLFLYHLYSGFKHQVWPFNSIDNPESISNQLTHPVWCEYISIIIGIILIYRGFEMYKKTKIFSILIIITSIIFSGVHLRKIFYPNNYYYKGLFY